MSQEFQGEINFCKLYLSFWPRQGVERSEDPGRPPKCVFLWVKYKRLKLPSCFNDSVFVLCVSVNPPLSNDASGEEGWSWFTVVFQGEVNFCKLYLSFWPQIEMLVCLTHYKDYHRKNDPVVEGGDGPNPGGPKLPRPFVPGYRAMSPPM